MLSINTNINNLKLQRHLNSVSAKTQTAMERMSTGYRINSASDDAAGLVISKALKVQENGLTVANENAQMATNILNVADGALSKMTDLTLRIRDLALQASNGGYSQTERSALQQEASQLTQNMEQLIQGTQFNEFKVFGEQPPSNTIKVGTARELLDALNSTEALNNEDFSIALTADIDLNDLIGEEINGTTLTADNNWIAIGDSSNSFQGTFDGNGFTIRNLKINKTSTSYQGLFGYTNNATIQNVNLENAEVKGGSQTALLVGSGNYSTIINCSVEGKVVATGNTIGGVLGIGSYAELINCSSSAEVSGQKYVGVLMGSGYTSKLTNCFSHGEASGTQYVGGLAGSASSATVVNSFSAANVKRTSGTDTAFAGFIGNAGNLTIKIVIPKGKF